MYFKYYTPNVKEFHIGFRYQVKWNNEDGDVWMGNPKDYMTKEEYEIYEKEGFLSRTMVPNDYKKLFMQTNSRHELRVKKLDREDIQELNFIPFFSHEVKCRLNSKSSETVEVYKRDKYYILYNTTYGKITIAHLNLKVNSVEDYLAVSKDAKVLYNDGVLRNYNELEKTLNSFGLSTIKRDVIDIADEG